MKPDSTNRDKPIHNRRSIRLKGYDYSKTGTYFITICAQNRVCLFGEIENGEMILNNAGTMINKWWKKIPEKFPDIELGVYQIMPNHFHAIVINNGMGNPAIGTTPDTLGFVWADPRVCPNIQPTDPNVRVDPRVNPKNESADPNVWVRANPRVRPKNETMTSVEPLLGEHAEPLLGEHMGSPLHRVAQWFKTMTTNEYIRGVKTLRWIPFDGKLWQRNYYEHIIRDEKSSINIHNYIINNPAKWKDDKFHIK